VGRDETIGNASVSVTSLRRSNFEREARAKSDAATAEVRSGRVRPRGSARRETRSSKFEVRTGSAVGLYEAIVSPGGNASKPPRVGARFSFCTKSAPTRSFSASPG